MRRQRFAPLCCFQSLSLSQIYGSIQTWHWHVSELSTDLNRTHWGHIWDLISHTTFEGANKKASWATLKGRPTELTTFDPLHFHIKPKKPFYSFSVYCFNSYSGSFETLNWSVSHTLMYFLQSATISTLTAPYWFPLFFLYYSKLVKSYFIVAQHLLFSFSLTHKNVDNNKFVIWGGGGGSGVNWPT